MTQDGGKGEGLRRRPLWALPVAGALLVLMGGAPVGQTTDVAGQIARTEELLRGARELRDRLMADPQRPTYHFMPPAGWMNDINGTVFWKGRYHLFYQAYPDAAHWQAICWGHASSVDLVHWVHHPIILSPTAGGPDREGCFSGTVVIHEGVPTAVYHGAPDGTCLATSTDDLLIHWTKHPANPVMRVPREGDPHFGEYIVYDPCAWQEGDTWYALCGGTTPQGRDTGYLFRSADLVNWEYVRPFYEPNPEWTELGEDCAVPTFFPLGRKYMLLFVSHKCGCQYYLGKHPRERFIPEVHGRMNWAGGQLIAPKAQDARQRHHSRPTGRASCALGATGTCALSRSRRSRSCARTTMRRRASRWGRRTSAPSRGSPATAWRSQHSGRPARPRRSASRFAARRMTRSGRRSSTRRRTGRCGSIRPGPRSAAMWSARGPAPGE